MTYNYAELLPRSLPESALLGLVARLQDLAPRVDDITGPSSVVEIAAAKALREAAAAIEALMEQRDFWESRCRLAVRELKHMAAQDSGKIGSTARADCMAVMAKLVLRAIGPLPEKQP